MDVKSVILGFLCERDMTGYELRKKFSLSFSFFSELSYGSVYPALKTLHRDGLVLLRDETEGPRRRKVYAITATGRNIFMSALEAPLLIRGQKNEFLMRLFFFSNLETEEQLRLATVYLESIRSARNQLEEIRPEIEGRANRWQYLCFQFGLRFYGDLAVNVEHVIEGLRDKNRQECTGGEALQGKGKDVSIDQTITG